MTFLIPGQSGFRKTRIFCALVVGIAGGGSFVCRQAQGTQQDARSRGVPLAVGVGPLNANAASSGIDPLDALLKKKGDVTFRQTPLSEVIFSLSSVWQVNIVAGREVNGEVSGVFANVPLSEVLDAVLSANGYGYKKSGQSLVILPIDSIGNQDPNLRSKTLALAMDEDQQTAVIEAAKMLLSPRGQIQAVKGHDSVLIVDTHEGIAKVEQFFEELLNNSKTTAVTTQTESQSVAPRLVAPESNPVNESPVRYFAPQYMKVAALAEPLQAVLGESAKINAFPDENRILVMGTPEQLQLATDVVRSLDIPRAQVRISALIYDVELRQGEALGIDWGQNLSINGTFGGGTATADTGDATATGTGDTGGDDSTTVSATATGVAVTLGTLGDTLSVSHIIRALDETRGAHLLADPTITVADRNEASIKIVTKIPYQQLTQTQQGGNIGTTAFEEAGITLTVTPTIAADGTIQMQVRPEFSTLVEYVNGQPLIDSRTAQTTVRVADRHTLVIGGLRRKQMRDAITGLPGLRRIRKLGFLFGAHDSSISESELLVFLRPEVVTPFDQLRPREIAATETSNFHLDHIPVAQVCPMVEDCNDKRCVYHHPRPPANHGAPSLTEYGEGMIGESGITPVVTPETIAPNGPAPLPIEGVPVQTQVTVPAFRQDQSPIVVETLPPQVSQGSYGPQRR